MTYTSEIYGKAAEILGSVPEERADALTSMCEAAERELASRLRDGVTAAEIEEAFTLAAGVLALSMYVQLGDAGDESSVKIGNIAVSRRGSGSVRASAANLRKQAESMLTAYLKDRGFDFRGVRG